MSNNLLSRFWPRTDDEVVNSLDNLDEILNTLTSYKPKAIFVDKIAHTGNAGTTLVERWPLRGIGRPEWANHLYDHPEGIWVWRLMWRPAGAVKKRHVECYYPKATRIAYGVAHSLTEATTAGSAEARRLAKKRRARSKRHLSDNTIVAYQRELAAMSSQKKK